MVTDVECHARFQVVVIWSLFSVTIVNHVFHELYIFFFIILAVWWVKPFLEVIHTSDCIISIVRQTFKTFFQGERKLAVTVVASVHACLSNVQKSPIFFRETLLFHASVFSKIKFKNLFNRQWIYYFPCLVSNDEVNTQVFRRGAFMRQDCVARGDYRTGY